MSSIFVAVGITGSSMFCQPSRGPSSRIRTAEGSGFTLILRS